MALRGILSNFHRKISTTITATATASTQHQIRRELGTISLEDMERFKAESESQYHGLITKGLNNPYSLYPLHDSFFFRLDMPGIRTSDLRCVVVGSKISLSAQEPKPHRFGSGRLEPRYYETVLELDPDVYDSSRVDANVKNGVLWVKVPKFRVGPELGRFSLHIGRFLFSYDNSDTLTIVQTHS